MFFIDGHGIMFTFIGSLDGKQGQVIPSDLSAFSCLVYVLFIGGSYNSLLLIHF